jgi:hypothetical protein
MSTQANIPNDPDDFFYACMPDALGPQVSEVDNLGRGAQGEGARIYISQRDLASRYPVGTTNFGDCGDYNDRNKLHDEFAAWWRRSTKTAPQDSH